MKEAERTRWLKNEASCVVFGMPAETIEMGAMDGMMPLNGGALDFFAHAADR